MARGKCVEKLPKTKNRGNQCQNSKIDKSKPIKILLYLRTNLTAVRRYNNIPEEIKGGNSKTKESLDF